MINSNFSTIPTKGNAILYVDLREIPAAQWESAFRLMVLEGFIPQIKLSGTGTHASLYAVLYEGEDKPELTYAMGKLTALIGVDSAVIVARA